MTRKDTQKKGESAETAVKSRGSRRGKNGDPTAGRKSSGDHTPRSKQQTRSKVRSESTDHKKPSGHHKGSVSGDSANNPPHKKKEGQCSDNTNSTSHKKKEYLSPHDHPNSNRRAPRRGSAQQQPHHSSRKPTTTMVDQQIQTDPPLGTHVRSMFATPGQPHSSFSQLYPTLSANYSPWNQGKISAYESPNEQLRRWSGETAVQTESDTEEDPLYPSLPLSKDSRAQDNSFSAPRKNRNTSVPQTERELQIIEATAALDALCKEIDSPRRLLPAFAPSHTPASDGWLDVPTCCSSVIA